MNNEIYIWHHLGLGDHITCNAIVRNYAKMYDKVYLFVKYRNLDNVKYLYRDLNNIEFIYGKGEQDEFVHFYLMTHPNINLLKLWLSNEKIIESGLKFDELFYKEANIPFSKKMEDCFILRDEKIEEQVCKTLNPKNEPYIFVHHDTDRDHKIDFSHFKNKSLKVIESNFKLEEEKDFLIFHYLKLIENAAEIHVMESSFSVMIDVFIENHNDAYLHKYVRNIDSIRRPYWKIIN